MRTAGFCISRPAPSRITVGWPTRSCWCPYVPWIMNILPIQSVDAARGVLRTSVPGTYPLGRTEVIDLQNMTFVENVLEELDEPGEWVLDSEAAKLYLWPQGEEPGDDIAIPLLTELVRVEGKMDDDGRGTRRCGTLSSVG